MSSSSLLRGARRVQGVSQRDLALRSGVPQPRIAEIEAGAHDPSVSRIEVLVAALGHRMTLLPTRSRPVWEAGLAVAEALGAGDEPRAWREVIQLSDDLSRAEAALRVALSVLEPARTGDARYDALLAGIVDYWLTADRLPRPKWVRGPGRSVNPAWDVEPVVALQQRAREATPPSIARHGIYLAAAELQSV